MSNVRRFKSITDEKLKQLKEQRLKKRSFAKVQWAVRAYCDWRNHRLSDPLTYDYRIFEADINQCSKLGKMQFEYSMCKFIAEVTKVKDGSDYPGKTLYQLCIAIQKHLNMNGVYWKIVEGDEFVQLRTVLDNVMKERAEQNIGMVVHQAEYITPSLENELWEKNVLGEQTPDQLRDTVVFLLGLNLALRAGDEHYYLRRNSEEKASQLSFRCNDEGVRCLVYQEDSITKTNDGGLASMHKDRKIVWVYPSADSVHCPVHLVEKYMSLCPAVTPKTKKMNFHLRSLEKPTVTQWYGEQVVGRNTLRKVTGRLLKNVKLGHYTNHSLRRRGTSRLFQAGVDTKLIRKFTGHRSDALYAYETTSDGQRERMSKIIQFDSKKEEKKQVEPMEVEADLEISVNEKSSSGCVSFKCNKKKVKSCEIDQISEFIDRMLKIKLKGRATIKVDIQFDH